MSGCGLLTDVSVRSQAQKLFDEPQPLPEALLGVQPRAGSMVSLSSNNPGDLPVEWSARQKLCVEFNVPFLLEPGDHFAAIGNIELSFDGEAVPLSEIQTYIFGEIIGANGGFGPGGDAACWEKTLSRGIHIADIRVWKTSGTEYTYSWAFEVIP